MITDTTLNDAEIAEHIRRLLGSAVDARREGECVRVLTPFEYPDGDGVVVLVALERDGLYAVSDGGQADATLAGMFGSRAVRAAASQVASRFDATFDNGQIKTVVGTKADLADACQRVAQAAAALAEASTYLRRQPPKEAEFADVIAWQLKKRKITVQQERKLEGASGHEHRTTLFIPATETVIEPVGGDRAWQVASAPSTSSSEISARSTDTA